MKMQEILKILISYASHFITIVFQKDVKIKVLENMKQIRFSQKKKKSRKKFPLFQAVQSPTI